MDAGILKAMTDEQLADLWYAMGCTVKEFAVPFKEYMDAAFTELLARRPSDVNEYLALRKLGYTTVPDQRSHPDRPSA